MATLEGANSAVGGSVSNLSNVSGAFQENPSQLEEFGGYYHSDYETVKNVLQRYVVPVIILTGFVGNTICFIVFIASSLKKISTSAYLAALAFSDTGFLFCLGIGWLEALGIRFFHKEGVCQTTVYAAFVFSFTSIWFVNAFTMEMYIAVFHPQKGPKLCTPRNARKVVCLISVIAGLLYIYAFWLAKLVQTPLSGQKVCQMVQEDKKIAIVLSITDTILTLIVPFTMIIFMISRLFVHISKFYKAELESMANSVASENHADTSETRSNGAVPTANSSAVRQANDYHSKLTRMLVVTVVVFLVLNLPSHAIKVQFLFRSMLSDSIQFTETEGLIQVIFQVLYYSNFSVNFILYSVCGKSFRSALMRVSMSLCYYHCKNMVDCRGHLKRLTVKTKMTRGSGDHNQNINDQQHSRLVDIHLNEIRFSQLPSMGSQFVCQSPPCLLQYESEHLIEHQ